MIYVLDSSATTRGQVVLRRSRLLNRAMQGLTLAVGLPTVLLGLALMAFTPSSQPQSISIVGLGLFLASIGQLISTQFRAPHRLIFDNDRGHLLIDENGRKDKHAASVPYTEIEGFHAHPHATLSGIGHGEFHHVVEMNKRNGAVWTLAFLSPKDASELARRLGDDVELDRPVGRPSHPHEPRLVRVQTQGEDTVVTWRRRYSIAQSALLLSASIGLLVMFSGVSALLSPALQYGALGCSGLLALLSSYALFDAAIRARRIVITAHELRANCGVGNVATIRVPLDEIDAVVFHFAPSQRDMLFVLRASERKQLMHLTRGRGLPEDAFAARALLDRLAKIEVGDLTMPQKLNLEHLLRRVLQQRTGRVIH